MAVDDRNELLLKGGHLIDPKNGIDAIRDIAICAGKITGVFEPDERQELELRCKSVIDIGGLYVTPGLVDMHTHLFATTGIHGAWAGDNSVMPDGFSFRSGTTTMVDAGSSGRRNFEDFRLTVIDRSRTRVLAFVNIAGYGMMSNMMEQDKRDFDPQPFVRLKEKHADVVVGVKSAHYEQPDWASVEMAVQAGELARLPVMVDFGYFRKERPYWQLVAEKLRPGDISTHFFRASVPFVDENGKLLDYLLGARERGVIFDVGHGGGSFIFRNAVPVVKQGFFPDSISTDLHTTSMNGAMIDLPTTMSKFLAMEMPLAEVVRRSTWNPACIINHPELGQLSTGAVADVAVWRLQNGDFGFVDVAGGRLSADRRLSCEMTLKDGKAVWDWNGRSAVNYEKLGPGYGTREGVDHLILPP